MRAFTVTVRKNGRVVATYPGIGNPFDLHADAIDQFGPSSITVVPVKEASHAH
jgi:hypothetical protein